MPNYLQQLLEKIEDVEARGRFSELAEQHSEINNWIVDPELRAKTEEVSQWANDHWDYDHGMSRLEFEQQEKIAAYEADKGSQGMELEDLNAHLGKFIKDNGLMTRAEYDAGIKEKETAFGNELEVVSVLATRIPYLNARHNQEFGEMFDPDEFVTKAHEKGYARYGKAGLDKFYDEYTVEKRTAKQKADVERQVAEAEERGRKKGLSEVGMGGNRGAGPALDGEPDMGHFEAKLKGISRSTPEGSTSAPADAQLGSGAIARFAANAADQKDRAALVN